MRTKTRSSTAKLSTDNRRSSQKTTQTSRARRARNSTAPTRRGARSATAHSQTTTDHEFIRRWAEERGGTPSQVKGTQRRGKDAGLLRIDFPGYSGAGKLEPISWDEFFEKFEESGLALVYQEKTSNGERSNFNELVSRQRAAK